MRLFSKLSPRTSRRPLAALLLSLAFVSARPAEAAPQDAEAKPAPAASAKFTPSPEDMKRYRKAINHPMVVHLRNVLDTCLRGEDTAQLECGAFEGISHEKLQGRFVVYSFESLYGADKLITIAFPERPGTVFGVVLHPLADDVFDLQLVEERRLSDAERATLEARLPAFTEAALSR